MKTFKEYLNENAGSDDARKALREHLKKHGIVVTHANRLKNGVTSFKLAHDGEGFSRPAYNHNSTSSRLMQRKLATASENSPVAFAHKCSEGMYGYPYHVHTAVFKDNAEVKHSASEPKIKAPSASEYQRFHHEDEVFDNLHKIGFRQDSRDSSESWSHPVHGTKIHIRFKD